MAVIIEELNIQVDNGTPQGGGENTTRPAENSPAQSVVDALKLFAERNARLAAD